MLIYPIQKKIKGSHHHKVEPKLELLGYILTDEHYSKKYIIVRVFHLAIDFAYADYSKDHSGLTITRVRVLHFPNGMFCDSLKSELNFLTIWDMIVSEDIETKVMIKDMLYGYFKELR